MKKHILGFLLATVMVVSLLTTMALANTKVTVKITGTEAKGNALTAEVTGLDDETGVTYQWYRCDTADSDGTAISGATSKNHNVSQKDVGYFLKFKVSVTADSGNTEDVAEAVTTGKIKDAFYGKPTITVGQRGEHPPYVGEAIQASIANVGFISGEVKDSEVTFQWLRCDTSTSKGTAIEGATAGSYIPTNDDAGKYIKVEITGKPECKYGGSKTSSSTKQVKFPPAAAPSVTTADAAVTATTVKLPVSGETNTYEYSTDGTNWNDTREFTDLTPATQYTYYVRVKGTDTAMPSEIATISLYTAPTTPESVAETGTVSYADESFEVNDGYEISTKNGTESGDTFEDGKLTPDANKKVTLEPGTTYYIRKKASGSVPASAAVTLSIPARPETPKNTPALGGKTDTSISITAVDGQEYSIDGGITWVTDGGEGDGDSKAGTITFAGLKEKTKYSIVTRVKAVSDSKEESFASENSSASVIMTKETAPAKGKIETVDVINGKFVSDGNNIEVKDKDGESVSKKDIEKVAEAINTVLNNDKVNNFGKTADDTGIAAATEASDDKIVDALKAETDDIVAKDNVNSTDISKYLSISLVSANVDVDTNVTVTNMVFDVTPMATITVTGSDGQVTLTTEITNDEINGTVTFRLPVDKSITAKTAAIYHEGEFIDNYEIKTDNGNKYIEVTTDSFSNFGYIILDETTAGAKIGTTLYASLSDATCKVENNGTITLLKDVSGTISVSREVTFTIDTDIYELNATIKAGKGYRLTEESGAYIFEEVKCVYNESAKLAEGKLGMKLGGKDNGKFTFAQVNDGWSIYNGSKYLAMQDGKLVLSDTPFEWTYKNGAFSASVETTQRTNGYWFFFIYFPGNTQTVTTTYYLSTVTDGAYLSTMSVSTEFYKEIFAEHEWGTLIDCNDGNHKHTCKNCGEVEIKEHKYDEITHKCICGAYDPTFTTVDVTATYDTNTQRQFSGFLFWGTWRNVTTYTATVKVNATGLNVTKVEVAASENGMWIQSNTFTANSEISQFFVRVTTSDGAKHLFRVANGIGYPVN